ncbi:7,8-dihydropterin-6-yl-methyl-4-(beta-D-ribofuranosyl)aminobenzene 5'-phosphate synthase [Oscillibacter sp. PC13]|uniref:MBL fold metallo-hydrolase n=1 Tax=Oscillibacter sp. PC13 TaxID=1855299 RepID=UPI0008E81CA8|nr:MBL fold metallo-hydrolase [Oscillibacter sp. PC13]SFP47961.1 7,8-dihydropterin-6-yl-methyl-4-(beta-D-ribofuranosyl)aminobenzene 5'-phosphate synthase [Oscillibacter sp. PC13]
MYFHENLLRLRHKNSMKQQEVADGAGLSLRAYQNYERGLREPQLTALTALADFYDLPLDELVGRKRCIRVTTLLENTACREDLCHAHGLSLYIETPRHKILFDMGPNDDFLANAKALGVDLAAVDLAVLSHGHYDHGGGLAAFCRLNSRAQIYLHRAAFGAYYAREADGALRYIGLPLGLEEFRDRFVLTGEETVIDRELTLFANPAAVFDIGSASAKLGEKVGGELLPDAFRHEQSLLIQAAGKSVLVAGCAHRGAVNILAEARRRLGKDPDALFGGFHLFELAAGDPAADALIDATGEALLPGKTMYYTGHCTGAYAYERLSAVLGERLRPMTGGSVAEI